MSLYKTILVAVDFSPAAEAVTARALELAARCDAGLELIHVVEYLPPLDIGYEPVTAPEWSVDEQVLIDNARQSLQTLAERHGVGSAPQHVELGPPRHVIVRVGEERGADLIVIGSHGRHGIGRLLGSTADGVLHHAPCDVLAVRIQS